MMKILLAAGADPKLVTATNTTAVMAATGLNHLVGESAVTEAQASRGGKISARSRPGSEGADDVRGERVIRSGLSRLEYAVRAIDRPGRGCECGQQGRCNAVARGESGKATGSAAFFTTKKVRICCSSTAPILSSAIACEAQNECGE